MRKLSLSADDLRVESFETSRMASHRGTVPAHSDCTTVECSWGDCTSVEGCSYAGCSDSTCKQKICTCTEGGDTGCDYSCHTCYADCETDASCPTQLHYPGC